MSDERTESATPTTAGGLLRQARQAQGMHIAVLAAATKVAQRKLEALEGDRFDELPDATFTRALAQTVCRTLKIDPAPVLALLPRSPAHGLEHVGEGINAPFRERPGHATVNDGSLLGSPAVWGPLVILVLAAVVYFLPAGLISLPSATPASAPAAAVPDAAASLPVPMAAPAAPTVVETVSATPPGAEPAASAVAASPVASAPVTPAPPAASGVLLLRTSAESWIEVLDGRGQTLLSRLLLPGEAVGLDGVMPLKVTIGNASATQATFRGRQVDLTAFTRRDNVARLDLK